MPFIGKENLAGQYALLDAITTNGSASYTMQREGVNFEPQTERNMIVSVNGVTQAPVTAYTISGSTITFSESLQSDDTIDYILILGDVFDIGRPSDDAVDTASIKNGAVTVAKMTIDGDLVPAANLTYDLGSSTMRWNDLYLSGNTINLGDATITADGSDITIGSVTIGAALSGDGSSLTSLNASQLSSGTVPDARFPATLPSANGTNLTSLNATEITTGTIDNARLPSNINVANDLTIAGDLFVNGNTTTIAANELKVEDSLIQLASNNETSDTVDIGFVGHYYDGSTQVHTGFFRDASDEQYYLFKGYEDADFDTDTPPATIDRTANTFSLANLVVNKLGVGTSPTGSDLHIDSNGTNTTLRFQNSTLDDGYIQFTNAGKMRTYTSGIIQTTLDSSGNFGIGTDNPSRKLYVSGSDPLNAVIESSTTGAGIGFKDSTTTADNVVTIRAVGQNLNLRGAADIEFTTNSSERMRIDSSGDVGYTGKLYSSNSLGTVGALQLYRDHSTGSCYLFDSTTAPYSGPLIFGTNNVEAMRIDASGNVGIGTSTINSGFVVDLGSLTVPAAGASTSCAMFGNSGSNGLYGTQIGALSTGTGYIQVQRADGTASTYDLLLQPNGGNVGIGTSSPARNLSVVDASAPHIQLATSADQAASNGFEIAFDGGANYIAGRENVPTLFYTNNTERLRIGASGNVSIGTSSTGGNSALTLAESSFTIGIKHFASDGQASNSFEVGGSVVGSITHTTTSTAYNTSSDQRLKENIVDAPAGNIDDIRVRSFDWKADGTHQTYGMVAQELIDVAPEAVSQGETEDDMWGVDYSKLVPMMIKEIQDLKAKVKELESR